MIKLLGPSLAVVLLAALVSANPVIPSSDDGPFVITAENDDVNYRLNSDVLPSKYEVTITPNLNQWTFVGHVIITLKAQVAGVNEIVLHSNDLEILNIKVTKQGDPVDLYEKHAHDAVTHKLTISTKSPLDTTTAFNVEINYNGYMKDDMAGFYRSTYTENGVEKRLGSTQFQTTSARRAFPCFDEPKFKAVFDLKFRRTAQYNTIANTKLKQTNQLDGGILEDVYESTPVMSTYLIAFIISEYTPRKDERFGVWARPEMYEKSLYAYDVGVKLLNYFNTYTADNYYSNMAKMDMAAVPDFSAGNSFVVPFTR